MENLLKSPSLIQRAYWLIMLRWVAIATLAAATFVSYKFMGVQLPAPTLYALSALLLIYNLVLYILLRRWTGAQTRGTDTPSTTATPLVEGSVTFQISGDLLILAAILHFSGGVENPFSFFFVFHMIIASILRSKRQSYLQATLAVFLFSGIVILEGAGILPHYGLTGFAGHQLYRDRTFLFGFLFVFSVTLYLVVYMTTSISEQLRRQQEDLQRANAQLEEKDHVKNEYVLRVTHDIKGHLAAVQSCLETVLSELVGPLNEKQKDMVGRAHRRTIKCMEFVTALLTLTRMKLTGRFEMEEFSLRKTLLSVLALVQNRAHSKSIALHHQIDPAIDMIRGEGVLIEETIANILLNAVRYTPAGGRVAIDARQDGSFVRVSITDTGIGVPPADLTHIFEEFYRADNARATERDGTGLGLAFAKQVIERHGGRIRAENNPTGGSTFTFTLPAGQTARGSP
ncbi:MAG: HAMP domain-containing histidine kinase [Sedimentisphaerales bacterium]|nr:HAMP domain-containing histidine kinase [Sedimentisphaerales bacterium]